MSPLRLFRRVAIAEACTWALLLAGMFVKYATDAERLGELGVRIGGTVHGAVFLAYGLVTVLVWIDQRWPLGKGILGLIAAVPPFVTIPFDRHAERAGLLGETWRLRAEQPRTWLERVVAWLLARPASAAALGVVAVAALFGLALLVGPPTS